jgi:hypothetical protein
MSDPIRMTAHAIGAAVDFNEIDAEDKFVDAQSYDALAADLVHMETCYNEEHAAAINLTADLARCRAANVYDGNAHRRVSELEAREALLVADIGHLGSLIRGLEVALRKYGDHTIACDSRREFYKGPGRNCDCGWTDKLTGGLGMTVNNDKTIMAAAEKSAQREVGK